MSASRRPVVRITSNALILLVAGFLTAFANGTFYSNLLKTYPLDAVDALPLLSVVVVFGCATVILLAVLCFRRTLRPVLILFLLLSSLAAYFMDTFGIVVSDDMLQNIAQTNSAEASDLVTGRLAAYVTLLGIAPAIAVLYAPVRWRRPAGELVSRLMLIGITVALMTGLITAFGSFYATFFREHKELRAYVNPGYFVYSTVRYASRMVAPRRAAAVAAIGTDARIPAWDRHRELIIVVVGETARADRFSLNGYPRDTNPLLRAAGAISFTNTWACGTSTAVSVPCMFSLDDRPAMNEREASVRENLLDVLNHAGVNVLWLDNNSSSKGVALRVPYRDYKSPEVNPVCNPECRDEGMLASVQRYIDEHPTGDIVMVLHQMGNHGPAYYRRYPADFERFRPACRNDDLSRCSQEEIDNAYDNAILYTDHFLAEAIKLLEANDARFETALFYVSDHGESLGERGVYLHGLPKAIAPEAQLRVPMVLWFGKSFDEIDRAALAERRAQRFTHANVFHTVLGLLEVESAVYRRDLDILEGARMAERRAVGELR